MTDEHRSLITLRYGPIPKEMRWDPIVGFFNELPLEFRIHNSVEKAWSTDYSDFEYMLLQLINFDYGYDI